MLLGFCIFLCLGIVSASGNKGSIHRASGSTALHQAGPTIHGTGTLNYPHGGKYIANWERGVAVDGQYQFSDGLKFEDHNWGYLSAGDRRFYSEVSNGLQPAGRTQLTDHGNQKSVALPAGLYDTGEGFYSAKDGVLYDYLTQKRVRRITDPNEAKWIKTFCRRGFAGTETSCVVDDDEQDSEISHHSEEEAEAATKVQSLFRAKKARQATAEKRSATSMSTRALEEGAPPDEAGSGDDPEALAAWSAQLGEKGDAAAMKMQAKQRQKIAKKQVKRIRKQID
eukprot:g10659.t1